MGFFFSKDGGANQFFSKNSKTQGNLSNNLLARLIIYLLILPLLLFSLALPSIGATIKGTVYDTEIRPMKDVLIQINTTPIQRFIAKDGTYLFSLPVGTYNITAYFDAQEEVYYAEEIISITDNGKYLRDLFTVSTPKSLNSTSIKEKPSFLAENKLYFIYGGGVLIGLLIIWFAYILIKKTKKEPSDTNDSKKQTGSFTHNHIINPDKKEANEKTEDLQHLINLIKKNGGRMTQKDIRKEFSLSEAKVSLMISELEEKKIIKKIKKGRGNILILN